MFSKKRYFFVVFEVCLFFFVLWPGLLVDFFSVECGEGVYTVVSHFSYDRSHYYAVTPYYRCVCIEKKGSMHKI